MSQPWYRRLPFSEPSQAAALPVYLEVCAAVADSWFLLPGPAAPPRRRRLRVRRRIRRLAAIVITLGILGAFVIAGLLLVSPSVGDASARAGMLAHAHGVSYPGPPVPRRFTAALAAADNHRFYSESWIDRRLAGILYPPTWPWVTAATERVTTGVKLAFSYPRAEILRMYSKVADFGHGYRGLDQASCGYFGVPPARLRWPEAALLAGIVTAPASEDPISHFAIARAREAHVLGRLVAVGALTHAQADRAYREPLRVGRGGRPAPCGPRESGQETTGVLEPLLVLPRPADAGQVVPGDAPGEVVGLDGPAEPEQRRQAVLDLSSVEHARV